MTRSLFSARISWGGGAIVAATLALAAPVQAQEIGNMLSGAISSGKAAGSGGTGAAHVRTPEAPPGLPGTRSDTAGAAPAHKDAADMDPNEALFDAVNRGDIAAVQEALSRGANVDARNVLGLTPIDLAVDLGHSRITLLLLSMRRTMPAPAGPQPTHKAAASHRRAPPPPRTARRAPAPAPAPRPQITAENGGAPQPQAGFLGFGK